MIREIFGQIKQEYKKTDQHIQSLSRQMKESPEKFKKTMEKEKEEEQKQKEEEERLAAEEAAKKAAEDAAGEGAEGAEDGEVLDKSKQSIPPPKKRDPIDKQTAYIEFKGDAGKQIEDSIVMCRDEMKIKRESVKVFTQKINTAKGGIDSLKVKLDKKEEERKMQSKALQNDLAVDNFDDDVQQDEIIDEEELIMLKDMKDLKRDYRDNFSKLKSLKSDINNLQNNINASKEQMILQFENWYADEFQAPGLDSLPKAEIDMTQLIAQDGTAEASDKGLGVATPMYDNKPPGTQD